MTTTTDHAHRRPTGPIVCQPWCEYGDGHEDASCEADQILLHPSAARRPVTAGRDPRLRRVNVHAGTASRVRGAAATERPV